MNEWMNEWMNEQTKEWMNESDKVNSKFAWQFLRKLILPRLTRFSPIRGHKTCTLLSSSSYYFCIILLYCRIFCFFGKIKKRGVRNIPRGKARVEFLKARDFFWPLRGVWEKYTCYLARIFITKKGNEIIMDTISVHLKDQAFIYWNDDITFLLQCWISSLQITRSVCSDKKNIIYLVSQFFVLSTLAHIVGLPLNTEPATV